MRMDLFPFQYTSVFFSFVFLHLASDPFDPCSDPFCISRRWMVVLDRQPGVSFLA